MFIGSLQLDCSCLLRKRSGQQVTGQWRVDTVRLYQRTLLQPPPRPSPLWPVSPPSNAEVSCRRLIIDE